MQHETPEHKGDDDPVDGQRLVALYRAALLDEDFQQQVSQDMRALPETPGELGLHEKAFVNDETLSGAMRERLRALQDGAAAPSQRCVTAPLPWWKNLWRPDGWAMLPGPGFSLPATLAAGALFGVLVAPLLRLSPPGSPQFRGAAPAGSNDACAITDADRVDPDQWWAAIQKCEVQSEKEKQALHKQFPNYQSPSP